MAFSFLLLLQHRGRFGRGRGDLESGKKRKRRGKGSRSALTNGLREMGCVPPPQRTGKCCHSKFCCMCCKKKVQTIPLQLKLSMECKIKCLASRSHNCTFLCASPSPVYSLSYKLALRCKEDCKKEWEEGDFILVPLSFPPSLPLQPSSFLSLFIIVFSSSSSSAAAIQ